MNYEDERESNFKITNDALLTVGAFGINQLPFSTETTTTSIYEVASWGTLSLTDFSCLGIPNPDCWDSMLPSSWTSQASLY
jgi:hypothetical protein